MQRYSMVESIIAVEREYHLEYPSLVSRKVEMNRVRMYKQGIEYLVEWSMKHEWYCSLKWKASVDSSKN